MRSLGNITSKRAVLALILVAGLGFAGCDDDDDLGPVDREPPAAPRGFTSITGDEEVVLVWYPNAEWDLDGYAVYRNNEATGNYRRIAYVGRDRTEYVDRDVTNGQTYYYAVSAYDTEGNESDLSPELVFDTPRPQGYGVRMTSYARNRDRCAYDFSDYLVTDYDDPEADVAYTWDAETGAWMLGLNVPGGDIYTAIQDAGLTESLSEITWAPADGWSPRAMSELIEGHTYIVWTRDDHYAKFRVVRLTPDEVTIDWAYQIDRGNQELRAPGGGVRPAGDVHDWAR